MVNIINKRDEPLLRAFIEAESEDYHWKNDDNKQAFIDRVFKEIITFESPAKLDFVVIESLSNMGTPMKELWLTSANWGREANMLITLGTTPRDKLSFNLIERTPKGIRGWNPETGKMEL